MKSIAASLLAAACAATITEASVQAPFIEQFGEGWDARWNPSNAVKEMPAGAKPEDFSEDLYRYRGEWAVEKAWKNAVDDNEALVVKTAAAHHAISAGFKKPLDPSGKDLVIQYDLKFQEELQCGGAYIKLLSESKSGIKYQEFDDKTPYTIMFGPDKCGSTNKVHFIFRHQNPLTKEITEKHLTSPPPVKSDLKTNLYTVVVHPDNSMEMYINKEKVKSANLLTDFEPPVNPPKEISDPNDTKPADWVDEARIPDPDATKPDDWDEDAPRTIEDVDAEKPADWLDSEPAFVPDPDAVKPEDWDDEEDGTWTAPRVPNPKCDEVSGCGEWTRPMKANPAYKGKWYPPMIENPAYKGEWAARLIPNPDYYEDKTPSKFTKLSGVGIEIWTMQANIMFDDFYIGHSLEEAFKLADETWKPRRDLEDAADKEETKKAEEEAAAAEASGKPASGADDYFGDLNDYSALFSSLIVDPVGTAQSQPKLLATLVAMVLAPIVLFVILSAGGASAVKKEVKAHKKSGKADKAKVADAAQDDTDSATEADDSTAKEDAGARKRRTNKE